nr:MAG TPA: endonuclease I [Caudoviricetes sp.]
MLIKQQNPELDIRFIFSRSKTPIYKGSKTTYAAFC